MILFVDIDGTIRDYEQGFIPSAGEGLKKAAENGHTLILSTGRTIGMIPYDVPLELFHGMICGGGCYVKYGDKLLKNEHIPHDITAKYRRAFEEKAVPYEIECIDGLYFRENMAHIIKNLFLGGDLPFEKRSRGAQSERIRTEGHSLDVFDEKGFSATKLAFCLTHEQFGEFSVPESDGLTLIHFTDDYDDYDHCELIRSDCDKGCAVRLMLSELGLDRADAAAFGDSSNDLAMMAACGTSVCMGNAPDDIKAHADYVTEKHTDDGFYKALVKLGIIGQKSV